MECGGTILYVSENFTCKPRKDLEMLNVEFVFSGKIITNTHNQIINMLKKNVAKLVINYRTTTGLKQKI